MAARNNLHVAQLDLVDSSEDHILKMVQHYCIFAVPQIVKGLMVVLYKGMPQKQFYKFVA